MTSYLDQVQVWGATVRRIDDTLGRRAVVVKAESLIRIADDLVIEASDPDRPRIAGDFDVDGDRVSFGMPGVGLGRLTYRLVGREAAWHIAERETE